MSASSSIGFPAEHLLTESPPNYDSDRTHTLVYLILAFVFFAVVLPALLATPKELDSTSDETKASEEQKQKETQESNKKQQSKSKKNKKQAKQGSAANGKSSDEQSKHHADPQIVEYELNPMTNVYCVFWFVVCTVAILLKFSPDNYYTPRTVFEAPLFSKEECQILLDMADKAAQINYDEAQVKYQALKTAMEFKKSVLGDEEDDNDDDDNNNNVPSNQLLDEYNYLDTDEVAIKDNLEENKTIIGLLSEPYGWQKTRHGVYPTTDLNIVTDPFTKDDRNWISNILNARLAPLIERVYGVPASSIRANDMFVVRYDADKRNHLAKHTDDGSISFNVLLSDEFEDGGTRFWNRLADEPFAHVNPKQIGQVILNSAMIQHEGMHISSGSRTIFVGFLSVDRVDPFSFTNEGAEQQQGISRAPDSDNGGQPTGISWWASWGSLSWCTVKFKDGYRAAEARINVLNEESWMNHGWVRSLFNDMVNVLTWLGDVFEPHRSVSLVSQKSRDQYLKLLDDKYQYEQQHQREESNGRRGAVWFEGQQINTDITGEINTYWQTRLLNPHRFVDSEL